jgi:hypothetical protein
MGGVNSYSATPGSNTVINGMAVSDSTVPNTLDNIVRQQMADVRTLAEDIGGKNVSAGTDTITLTTSSGVTAYYDGLRVTWVSGGANSGAATLNLDSVGAKALVKGKNTALAANDIIADMACDAVYDASEGSGSFKLLNPATGTSSYQPLDSDLTTIAGLTATTDNFLQSKSSAWASRTPTQVTADLIAMVGDSGSGGTKGLVPAPASGDAAAGKFLKADGTWTVASTGFTAASQAEQETATSTAVGVTPGRQHFHPAHPKAVAKVTVSGGTPTLQTTTDYNITSITDTNTGRLTITIATDFSDAQWVCLATVEYAVTVGSQSSGGINIPVCVIDSGGQAAGSVLLECYDLSDSSGAAVDASVAATDPVAWHMIGIGDHA